MQPLTTSGPQPTAGPYESGDENSSYESSSTRSSSTSSSSSSSLRTSDDDDIHQPPCHHDFDGTALVTREFLEHARYWRAVELSTTINQQSLLIPSAFREAYATVVVHPQWFHKSVLNRYKKTFQSLCEHNVDLRRIPLEVVSCALVKKAFRLGTDDEARAHREPLTSEDSTSMLCRVASAFGERENLAATLALAILVDVSSADELVSLVAEVCDRMHRCSSAQHQGFNLVLLRAGRLLDALLGLVPADPRVTAPSDESEEALSRRQSSLIVIPHDEAPAASNPLNCMTRDESVFSVAEGCGGDGWDDADGAKKSKKKHSRLGARPFHRDLKRFQSIVEDYIADHKERAIASCLVQPARYYFSLVGGPESAVEQHGVNWLLASVEAGLGVVLPQTADRTDTYSNCTCCVWGANALTEACFAKFSDPAHFGKAYEGMSAVLSKTEDLSPNARSHVSAVQRVPRTPAAFASELQYNAETAARWQPVVRNFAHFFSLRFFAPKMLEVLNGETKPEHAGFRRLCQKLFERYRVQCASALPLRRDADDERAMVPAADFDQLCYKDDYYTELDVEAVGSFLVWTGVVLPFDESTEVTAGRTIESRSSCQQDPDESLKLFPNEASVPPPPPPTDALQGRWQVVEKKADRRVIEVLHQEVIYTPFRHDRAALRAGSHT